MSSRSKSRSRIQFHDQSVFRNIFHRFPGRFDNNMFIYLKRFPVFFPVIHPIDIFCLRFFNGRLSDIHKICQFFDCSQYLFQGGFMIFFRLNIKRNIGFTVIFLQIREQINEHPFFVFFRKRYLIFNFDTFNTHFCQCITD